MPHQQNRSVRLYSTPGITLIELMLSLALGCMLIGLLTKIYFSWLEGYLLQSSLSYLQNNSRKAITILNSELNKAGNIGCPRLSYDFPIVNDAIYSITAANNLMGKDDQVTMRYAESPKVSLLKQQDLTLQVSKEVNLKPGDVIVISDCSAAEIFSVANIYVTAKTQQITLFTPLRHRYQKHAELGKLAINTFYIANTGRLTRHNKPIYALFKKDLHQRKTELVEGVAGIFFRYSIKTQDKIIDKTAQNINDWSKVIGVAINLNFSSTLLKKIGYLYVALPTRMNE